MTLRFPLSESYDEYGNNISCSRTAIDMAWCHGMVDGLIELMRPLRIYAGL